MSFCAGKVYCRIYREKWYCNKGKAAAEGRECDCRHARYACEVNECHGAGDWCPGPAFSGIAELMEGGGGLGQAALRDNNE